MKKGFRAFIIGMVVLGLAQGAFALNFRETKQLADQGIADAQHNLGVMYYRGEEVERDLEQAVKWYRRAAEQGHARARINLAIMYLSGEGVKLDYGQAARWMTLAAEQGYADAQYGLANMYYLGLGVDKDPVKATEYYKMAARQGHQAARAAMKRLRDGLPAVQAPPAPHKKDQEQKPTSAEQPVTPGKPFKAQESDLDDIEEKTLSE